MNPKYRWLIWVIAALLVVISGFQHSWDMTRRIFLGMILVLGVLNAVTPALQNRMLRKIKAMPAEEREKFLVKFDPKTRAKLQKQLETC